MIILTSVCGTFVKELKVEVKDKICIENNSFSTLKN